MKIEKANRTFEGLYLSQIRHLKFYSFNIYYLGTRSKEGCYNHGCLRVKKSLHLNSSTDEGL